MQNIQIGISMDFSTYIKLFVDYDSPLFEHGEEALLLLLDLRLGVKVGADELVCLLLLPAPLDLGADALHLVGVQLLVHPPRELVVPLDLPEGLVQVILVIAVNKLAQAQSYSRSNYSWNNFAQAPVTLRHCGHPKLEVCPKEVRPVRERLRHLVTLAGGEIENDQNQGIK